MGISVRNAASPGGVLTASFGAGQGARRNRVQDMALQAMEKRKAQLRQIKASEEAQKRGLRANEASQERAYEEKTRDRIFREKSKRRSEDVRFKRQDMMQDKAFKNRTESQIRSIQAAEGSQLRGFEQQAKMRKAAASDRAAAAEAARDHADAVMREKWNRDDIARQERERQERLDRDESRKYAEEKEERDYHKSQKRRLDELDRQEAIIRENKDKQMSPEQQEDALRQNFAKRAGIVPTARKREPVVTPELKQKQKEFEFKQQQERSKAMLKAISEGRKLFTNPDTGTLDKEGYEAYKAEVREELGMGEAGQSGAEGVAQDGNVVQLDPDGGISIGGGQPSPAGGGDLNTFSLDMTPEQMRGEGGLSAVPNAIKVLSPGSKMDSKSRVTAINLLKEQASSGNVEAAKKLLEYRERVKRGEFL